MAPMDQSSIPLRATASLRKLAGKAQVGSLIFMPDIGGNAIYAAPLVGGLADVAASYAVQLPKNFSGTEETQSICEMADQFANAIIEAHIEGPIHLLGFSFAGFLAYETARQLAERGAPPTMVWLLDISRYRPLSLREFIRHPLGHIFNLSKYFAVNWRRIFFPKPDPDVMFAYQFVRFDLTKHPESYRDILRRNYASMQQFRPMPTTAPVTVLRATGALDAFSDDLLGWGDLLKGPARSFDVPGDHLSMLRDPENAQVIADLLRDDLIKAAKDAQA